jgi:hypothetical protein
MISEHPTRSPLRWIACLVSLAWISGGSSPLHAEDLLGTCRLAQGTLGGYAPAAVAEQTDVRRLISLDAFLRSKPRMRREEPRLQLAAYRPPAVVSGSRYEQAWCKLKSPEAIDHARVFDAPATERGSCDRVARVLLGRALAGLPSEVRRRWEASPYRLRVEERTLRTGSGWAPSSARPENHGGGDIVLETTSLVTPRWVPRFGGMHYCKLPTVEGLRELIRDLSGGDLDGVPFADPALASPAELGGEGVDVHEVRVTRTGQRATLYVPSEGTVRGTYLLSPGGQIPAASMRGLARALALRGQATYVVHYPRDLALWDQLSRRMVGALAFGWILRAGDLRELEGMPPPLLARYREVDLPLRVLGHSLGGAVLSRAVFAGEDPFDAIVLYGTTSFIRWPGGRVRARRLHALLGRQDGLSLRGPEDFARYQRLLGATESVAESRFRSPDRRVTLEILPELNHFGLVTDRDVGVRSLRLRDGPGLPPEETIARLVEHLEAQGLLGGPTG